MTEPRKPINQGAKETVGDGGTIVAGANDSVADDGAAAPTAAQPIARDGADTQVHRAAADTRGRALNEAEFKTLSRRSLLTGAGGALAAFVGWRTLQGRPESGNIPDVLRVGHETNERVWRTLFRSSAEAPTFDFAESSMMRVNGRHGIRDGLNRATWELRVVGRDGELLGTHQVDDLRALPQTEMTVEHKCVEGWSHIVTWGGVVFSEFLAAFYPEQADAKYVGLSNARWRLQRWARHGFDDALTDHAHSRPTTRAIVRRTRCTSSSHHAAQVRHEEHQAHWHAPVLRHSA